MSAAARHALVFGASGLIGRHLVLILHAAGVRVTTASRSAASYVRLRGWLAEHGIAEAPPDIRVNFDAGEPFSRDPAAWADITEIHNCAGAYRFGMSVAEARRANVGSVEAILGLAARLPNLRRIIHVSGYRVGGQNPELVPWSRELAERTYRTLGAYEASKVEADAVFQARARELGIPWSIVNPSSVIGDSRTGESDQLLGLAASAKELWQGTMSALPGSSRTFVPIVAVDYLARFMSVLATDETTVANSYWVLDDNTPALPDLLTRIGRHYRVKVSKATIPVGLIKRLPKSLTKADPETLTFLSEDRYPTGSATEVADRHGLVMPDTMTTIFRWADYLAAHRFGDAPGANRRFTDIGGVRTFELGEAGARSVILPGLPVNADSWARVATMIDDTRVLDLPGLGMSSGTSPEDWPRWIEGLIESKPMLLVGHSIGAAVALEAASRHPDRIPELTLVAPFFLQPGAGLIERIKPLTTAYLRRIEPAALARRLTGDDKHLDSLASSIADLRRGNTAAHVAALLALASKARWREALLRKLIHHPGDVHIIVGSNDPLLNDALTSLKPLKRLTVSTIRGAGHHPQLTHPERIARAIIEHRGSQVRRGISLQEARS